jgi:hypothetical protein
MNIIFSIVTLTHLFLFSHCAPSCISASSKEDEKAFLEWYLSQRTEQTVTKSPIAVDWSMLEQLSPTIPLTAKDSASINEQLAKGNVVEFKTAYPGKTFLSDADVKAAPDKRPVVYIKISHPIFIAEGKRIIFLVDEHCGALCGIGKLFVFEQTGTGYKKVLEELLWKS